MANINTTLAYAHGSATVADTVLDLTDFTGIDAADLHQAARMRLTVEAQPVRYRYDGGDATASSGHLLAAGSDLILIGNGNIANFRIIRSGGTSATVQVTLES